VSETSRAPTFAEIDATDQEWLWPGYIPDALLTVLIAPPKASKTTLCVDLAARVSRGDVMPDGSAGGPAAPVILAALEDGSETSIAHKLRAAKADLSNIVDVSGGPDGDGLELALDHVAWLRQVLGEHPGARLLIIDTLSASATRPITTHTGLKAMLKPLNTLGKDLGLSVVLTAHTRKDGQPAGGQALISIPGRCCRSPAAPTDLVSAPCPCSRRTSASRTLRGSGTALRATARLPGSNGRGTPGSAAQGRRRRRRTGSCSCSHSQAPMTAQLIASKTGLKYSVTRVLLSRMVRRGELISPSRGTYTTPREHRVSA
jgi:hypothetical protein